MGVSENSGTPKSSILKGFSIINHPFWGTPYFWKHPHPKNRSCCFFCLEITLATWLATWNVHHLRRINATALNGLASRECSPQCCGVLDALGHTKSHLLSHRKNCAKPFAVYLHGSRILRSWSSKVFVGVAKEKTMRTNHNTWTCFFRWLFTDSTHGIHQHFSPPGLGEYV